MLFPALLGKLLSSDSKQIRKNEQDKVQDRLRHKLSMRHTVNVEHKFPSRLSVVPQFLMYSIACVYFVYIEMLIGRLKGLQRLNM